MKRRVAMAVLIVMLAVMCMSMTCACVKDEEPPRKVEIEVLNPNTGEPINNGDIVDFPKEKTLIIARIKDKETGKYLTDDDLPENTVRQSYHINVLQLYNDGSIRGPLYTEGYWPIVADNIVTSYNYYEIVVFFDCRPEKPQDPQNFTRKYERFNVSVKFYRQAE